MFRPERIKGNGEVTGELAREMALRSLEYLKPWRASPRGIAVEGVRVSGDRFEWDGTKAVVTD